MTETQIASDNSPLVFVDNLFMHFPINKGIFIKRAVSHVRAVDGVSFQIRQGETLGVVGDKQIKTPGKVMACKVHRD